jgi:hypothetical protein
MKELTLIRDEMLNTHTEGRLILDGEEICKTLEAPYTSGDKRCIPVGEYQGASIPYKKETIYKLLDTPDRPGVLITSGNTVEDSNGNILVGIDFAQVGEKVTLAGSHAALQKLVDVAGHAIALKVSDGLNNIKDAGIVFKNNSFVDIDILGPMHSAWEAPKGCYISVNKNIGRRGIDVLHPKTKIKIQKMLDKCAAEGLRVLILDTLRTPEEQDKLYWQSRTDPPTGPKVTHAKGLKGVHVWGCAVDFCHNVRGQEYSNYSFFSRVGVIAEEVGLEWGGRWQIPDRPHVQDSELIGGTSTKALIEKYGNFEEFKKTW